jgi:hypothetical protein
MRRRTYGVSICIVQAPRHRHCRQLQWFRSHCSVLTYAIPNNKYLARQPACKQKVEPHGTNNVGMHHRHDHRLLHVTTNASMRAHIWLQCRAGHISDKFLVPPLPSHWTCWMLLYCMIVCLCQNPLPHRSCIHALLCCRCVFVRPSPDASQPGQLLSLSINSSLYEPNGNKSDMHAEMNAICMAANQGVSLQGATAYITMPPCR